MSIICSFPLPSCVVCRILFVLFSLERLLCCLPRAQRKRTNKMLMNAYAIFFNMKCFRIFILFIHYCFHWTFYEYEIFLVENGHFASFYISIKKCPILKLFRWLGLCRIQHWQECHEALCDSMTVRILLYLSSLNKFLNKVDVCLLSDSGSCITYWAGEVQYFFDYYISRANL